MYGKVDAEALLGALDEFLAESDPDIGIGDTLAVAHDRRHGENAERIPARFDADDRFAGPVRLHHGDAAPRGVVAESLGVVRAVEGGRRRCLESDQRDPLRLQRLHGAAEQRPQRIAVALDDGLTDRRQAGDHRADCQRRPPLIVERGDDAVILQLELLVERELRQRALLDDRECSEDGAGHRNRQRNDQDQAGRDRSKFEHGGFPKLRDRKIRKVPETA